MAIELGDVHLYRMSMPEHECPWGLKAIALLQRRGIAFQDHRLTSQEQVNAFKQRHNVPTTPQIFSGDRRIGGYSDGIDRAALEASSSYMEIKDKEEVDLATEKQQLEELLQVLRLSKPDGKK